jgi:hypothetical protein
MLRLPNDHEELDEILELNRLFLRYLKQRLETHQSVLNLPAAVTVVMRGASVDTLDTAAEFPRALFALALDAWMPWRLRDPEPNRKDSSYQALQLTLLHSTWNIARRSRYAARLFLGLSESEIKRLRATPLGELHGAALGNEVVGCAFADADWLWTGLLTETAPERRRQLRLLALQPNLEAPVAPPLARLNSSSR